MTLYTPEELRKFFLDWTDSSDRDGYYKAFANYLNAKLLKEGLVVYGHIKRVGHTDVWFYENEEDSNRFPDLCIPKTHKALLICIEKIEECKHEKAELKVFIKNRQLKLMDLDQGILQGFPDHLIYIKEYICECGARVTPTAFEKIKEK